MSDPISPTVYEVPTTGGPRYFFSAASALRFLKAEAKAGNPTTTRRTVWTVWRVAALLAGRDREIDRLEAELAAMDWMLLRALGTAEGGASANG